MFFDSETPSHRLACRAILYHLFPLAAFAAAGGVPLTDPRSSVWTTAPGHFLLMAIFDMLVICTVLSLIAVVKAWQEDIIPRKALTFFLFAADMVVTIVAFILLHSHKLDA
jgi:hypothetical protein